METTTIYYMDIHVYNKASDEVEIHSSSNEYFFETWQGVKINELMRNDDPFVDIPSDDLYSVTVLKKDIIKIETYYVEEMEGGLPVDNF